MDIGFSGAGLGHDGNEQVSLQGTESAITELLGALRGSAPSDAGTNEIST